MAETYNIWLKQENICYNHSVGGGVRGEESRKHMLQSVSQWEGVGEGTWLGFENESLHIKFGTQSLFGFFKWWF